MKLFEFLTKNQVSRFDLQKNTHGFYGLVIVWRPENARGKYQMSIALTRYLVDLMEEDGYEIVEGEMKTAVANDLGRVTNE